MEIRTSPGERHPSASRSAATVGFSSCASNLITKPHRQAADPETQGELMVLISPEFDIIAIHPALSKVFSRPMSSFIGKKCYRELEKRAEVCPHCAGVRALRTGAVQEAETEAVLDDGTRIPYLVRSYPVQGPHGEPAGFIESVVNTDLARLRTEYARFDTDLMNALLETSSTFRVMRLGLDAALRLADAEGGCAFLLDPATGSYQLAAQSGLNTHEIELLHPARVSVTTTASMDSSLVVSTPVVCHQQVVAVLTLKLLPGPPVSHGWARLELLAISLALPDSIEGGRPTDSDGAALIAQAGEQSSHHVALRLKTRRKRHESAVQSGFGRVPADASDRIGRTRFGDWHTRSRCGERWAASLRLSRHHRERPAGVLGLLCQQASRSRLLGQLVTRPLPGDDSRTR